jgi:hypothetical protein
MSANANRENNIMNTTITDRQIADLQNASAAAGDHNMVLFCERALGLPDAQTGAYPTDLAASDARDVCADVIQAAIDADE